MYKPSLPSIVLSTVITVAAFAVALLGAPAAAAPPSVPAQISYQGLLLDDLGQPRTGTIDLEVRIFDALSGGTLVYTELFTSVALADGVFHLELGPTGEATDTPVDPLTTSLSTALAGDLVATASGRFVELTVGTEPALTRTQVLSVPYAELARSAENAGDAQSVNGLSGQFITALWTSTNLDDSGPPNDDPQEGLADTDGDTLLNFIDPDNDNDGLSDSDEVAQGSDINLVTPWIGNIIPSSGFSGSPATVTVTGDNFDPGMSVTFGAQGPTPMNVTATSFDADLDPQAAQSVDVTVTLPNGESATEVDGYTFLPGLFSLSASEDTQLTFDVTGLRTSVVGGRNQYAVDEDDDGLPDDTRPFSTSDGGAVLQPGQIALALDPGGDVAGLRCRSVGGGCIVELNVDSDGDLALDDETGTQIEILGSGSKKSVLQPSLDFDPSGNPVAGYVARGSPSGVVATVAHDRDGNGDFNGTNEVVEIETVVISANLAELAIDSAGRPAYVYYNGNFQLRAAHDRNGDGDFDDANELVTAGTTTGIPECMGADFAPDGDLVVVVGETGLAPRLLRDNNDDGDFADAGEDTALAVPAVTACDVETGGSLAVAHNGGDTVLLIDRNDDGDFLDADENVVLEVGPSSASHIEVAFGSDDTAIVTTELGIFVDLTP